MRKADYIDAVVAQEDFGFFNKKMGNLSVHTEPPVATYRRRNQADAYFGTRPQPTRAELRYYAVSLWGALFAPSHDDPTPRPRLEFVNVGRYSVSTSSNQRKLYTAIEHAGRAYTPVLVIDPKNTGGQHWDPGYDWVAPMSVALDWCAENGLYAGFGGAPSTVDNPWGWPSSRKRSPEYAEYERTQALARQGGALLGYAFNADAFWILETPARKPRGERHALQQLKQELEE